MRLKNKIVIVTASSRGIGHAIVTRFAKEGARVYMAVRNLEKNRVIEEELRHQGYDVHSVYLDATAKESYQSAVDEVMAKEGRIDVLVNNFGTSDPLIDLDIEHIRYEDFQNIVDLNLSSVLLSSKAVIPHMKKAGRGSIINISSIGGIIPDTSRLAYTTSKAAINFMTRNMALQLGASGIRVNAVAPGMTATDSVEEHMSESFQTLFTRHTPLGRMAKPEEIAEAALYFALDESSFTTGQILTVAGGYGDATPVYADLKEKEIDH